MVKVVIVDDHQLVRQGFNAMLESEENIEVVGSFGDHIEVLDQHHNLDPQVFLMDIKMPKMNGFDLAASLKAQNHKYKIIFLSMEVNHTYIKRAITEKADGYIPKTSNIDIVLEAIHTVSAGGRYYGNDIKDYMFHLMIDNSELTSDPKLEKLSERELHILRMLVDGRQNKEIASLLFISTKTVETHRNNILKKLDISNTADLVKFAIAKGLTINPFD